MTRAKDNNNATILSIVSRKEGSLTKNWSGPDMSKPQYQQPQATGQTVRHAACRMKDFVCHSFQPCRSKSSRFSLCDYFWGHIFVRLSRARSHPQRYPMLGKIEGATSTRFAKIVTPWKKREKAMKSQWNPVKNPQNPVCAKNAKRMALRFCDQFFSWVLPLYVAAADLCQRHTEPLGNSQTCCMQDERLCLPLIPSFDVPFDKKGLKHVLVRLLWHGFTEIRDHVSPFCLESICGMMPSLWWTEDLHYNTGMCLWMAQGAQGLAHLALVNQHETTAKLAMFQEQR